MNKKMRELKELAEASGVSVDELLAEAEAGMNINKPYTVAVSFSRLKDLLEFAQLIAGSNVGVYQADALDREFGGRGGGNRFVLRSLDSKWLGKTDDMRVDHPDFFGHPESPDDDEE